MATKDTCNRQMMNVCLLLKRRSLRRSSFVDEVFLIDYGRRPRGLHRPMMNVFVALLLFPVEVIMTDNVSVRSTPNGDRLVDFFLHGMELLLTAGLLSSLPIGQQLTWSAGMLKGNGHHLSSHRLVYFHIIWGHSRPLPRAFLGCRLVFIFFPLHVGMLHGTFPPQ